MKRKLILQFGFFTAIMIAFLACYESKDITPNLDTLNSQEKIKKILEDRNFIELMKLDKKILEVNDTTLPTLNGETTLDLVNKLKHSPSVKHSIKIFQQAGINNSTLLFNLFQKKYQIFQELVTYNPVLRGLQKSDLSYLFQEAVKKYLSQQSSSKLRHDNISTRMEDACSQGYAVGMENCDNVFAISVGFSILAGAGATVVGTPVAGAATVSSGIGAAYLNDVVCRQNVVSNWKICRGYN